jgi:catechol 2,3-dioxygenase-like lactoylglutathione lyase family enzyme
MSRTEDRCSDASGTANAGSADRKLEVVTIPVSDADSVNEFYGRLGWRLDATPRGVVQFTPGWGCSVQSGPNRTSAAPGVGAAAGGGRPRRAPDAHRGRATRTGAIGMPRA